MALSEQDRLEIAALITTTVNGKIDKLNDKLDKHIETMEPYVQGFAGLRLLLKLLGSLAAALIIFDQLVHMGWLRGIINRI